MARDAGSNFWRGNAKTYGGGRAEAARKAGKPAEQPESKKLGSRTERPHHKDGWGNGR